jgi:tetratricopeptide (TPR) repeat protein
VSYGKATPYFPVIDLLRRYGHIEDQDDTRTIRAKVTGQVLTLDETLQDTLPALLSLLDAVPLVTRALEQTMATETAGLQAFCTLSLGEAHLLAGCLEEGHALTERALALAREHQERGNQAYALRLLGDIAMHRNPPESALAAAHYHQALALAEALGMRPLVAHCHRGLGILYTKLDRQEQARTELSTAIDLYRAMDMTFWLPQTEVALAQVGRAGELESGR